MQMEHLQTEEPNRPFGILFGRLQKRLEDVNGGAEVGLLEEDSCSVSSGDERQLRQSSVAVPRPPTSARALNAAEAAV